MTHRRRTALAVLVLLGTALVPLAASPPAFASGTVTVSVVGQGRVTGDGIDCTPSGGPDCSQFYADPPPECDPGPHPVCVRETAETTLTAEPDGNGFVFDQWWPAGVCNSTAGRTCTLVVTSDTAVTARYLDRQVPSVSPPLPPSTPAYQAGTIQLSATASDNSGSVSRVDFRQNGVLLGSDGVAPFGLPWDTTGVPDGTKSLTATAIDAAGNSTSSAESVITVDNTAPALSITDGPHDQTFGPGSTQEWTYSITDLSPVDVRCSVVAAGQAPSYGACSGGTSSHTVSDLPGGDYVLTVRAEDRTAHVTTTPASFSIDAVAPVTSVLAGPANGARLRTRSVRFQLGSDGESTFACRVFPSGVTGPAFEPCTAATSHTASGLADGRYTFQARATDPYGNVEATPATRTFVVDTVAPRTSIRSGPRSVVRIARRTARATFSFASESGARYRCKLDGQRWRSCTRRPSYVVGLGAHRLQVVAVDLAGNVDRTPAVRRWTVRRR